MAKGKKDSMDAIQKLLAEKDEVEQWLARLQGSGDATPSQVREKVEKDYGDRLEKVLGELEGYRDDVASSLDTQKEEGERLAGDEAAAEARLAEAELRHSVGEYEEKTWDRIRTEISSELTSVQADLGTVTTEIERLENILGLIDGRAEAQAAEDEEPSASAKPPAAEERESIEIAELEDIEDEESEESDKSAGRDSQRDAFDEMAFLKSVTEDEEQGPSPARASAGYVEPQIAEREVGAGDAKAVSDADGAPKKGKTKKSLKCEECGAQNLPTEWYCERCGAELASL